MIHLYCLRSLFDLSSQGVCETSHKVYFSIEPRSLLVKKSTHISLYIKPRNLYNKPKSLLFKPRSLLSEPISPVSQANNTRLYHKMGRTVRTVRRCALYLHLLSCLAFGLSSLGLAYAQDGSHSKEQRVAQEDQAAAAVAGELKDNDIIVNEDKGEGGLDSPVEKGGVDLTFVHAFVASLSVIIVSELGDKTFFIAAIMAMRHPRITIFAGALGALAVMTVLSALLGYAITIIPRKFTYYASTVLFFIFGVRMLREGWNMSPDEGQEELEEVQAELKRRDEEREKELKSSMTQDPESGIIRGGYRRKVLGLFSPILLEAFTLTFLAEWGDRSQMTTIVLAARENVLGVTLGGTLGHAFCTGLAVIGGRMIAQRISARTVTLTGGVVFLVFALSALFFSPDDS